MKSLAIVCGSTNIGGAELQLVEVLRHLSTDFRIDLIVIGHNGPFEDYLSTLGICYKKLKFTKVTGPIDFVRLTLRFKAMPPDIVIGWLYKGEIIGGIAARLARINLVIGSSRNTMWPRATRLKKIMLRLVRKYIIHTTVANSKMAEDWHKQQGLASRNTFLIPNFIRSAYENNFNSKTLSQNPITLGMAARAVNGKGHDILIEACSILRSKGWDVRLSLIGFGIPGWARIEELVKFHNIREHVTLLPGESDLRLWYSTLTFYVMGSDSWESDPNSLLEAVLSGVQVISSDYLKFTEFTPEICTFTRGNAFSLASEIGRQLGRGESLLHQELALRRQNLLKSRDSAEIKQKWLKALQV